jgi:purine nucleosidase
MALAGMALPWRAGAAPVFAPLAGPRARVFYCNDLSGDIDGLFATVHMVLSRSVDLRGVVGTGTGSPGETAAHSAEIAHDILARMGRTPGPAVYAGATGRIAAAGTPMRAPGIQALIDEAMRDDTTLPLYVAVGGGLTEVASALMIEPKIAGRFTLVWIGGDAYPQGGTGETNFNIDRLAAQYVFNQTSVPIWQVPRRVYTTCVVSASEIEAFVAPCGAIGAWLYDQVAQAPDRYHRALNMGETWTLGDSPLVVLTALGDWVPSAFRPFRYEHTGSSPFDTVVAPHLNADGTFAPQTAGRSIRSYTAIDTRLMFDDFFAKMRLNFPPTGTAPAG